MQGTSHLFLFAVIGALLAACSSPPKKMATSSGKPTGVSSSTPTLPKAKSGKGGYYQDDGPGDNPPPDLEWTLDAEPKIEPYKKATSKPYVVFGKTYTPIKEDKPFSQRGHGSWYGKKFHGQKTASGEIYDMYKMTAAHPTLPIPSYARITNEANGKQIIVRINDRGPFHSNRIVDLSYTAALKLDYLHKGSTELLLERLLPEDIEKMAENKKNRVTEAIAVATPVPAADDSSFEALIAADAAPNNNDQARDVNIPSGYYLQFGAFGLRTNAEATYTHLQSQLAQQLPTLEIVQQGALYRLFSGPFVSHAEASHAAQLALNAGGVKSVIVQR